MSATLTGIAWAVCHPRARGARRRPDCTGSRMALAAGCVCDGTVHCPRCGTPVQPEPWLPRAVRVAPHPEVKR